MAYEQKDMEGSLFRNDKGDNPRRPDFKGSIVINGEKYWLSAWNNPPRDNKKGFMGLKATPAVESTQTTNDDFDDEVPF